MKSPSFPSLLLLPKEASLMRGSSPGNSRNPGKGLEVSQSIISFEIGTYTKAESTDFLIDLPGFALATASLWHQKLLVQAPGGCGGWWWKIP